jgi:hypothetical protein
MRSAIPILCVTAACLSLSACAFSREPSRTPRTAIEQLLLSQAIDRSVRHLLLPIAPKQSVAISMAGFPHDRSLLQTAFPTVSQSQTTPAAQLSTIRHLASDLPVMEGKIEARLGELGLFVRDSETDYRARVTVEALGTEQGQSFFGMPPVQSVLLPFALPELTLFKAQLQRGYARYTMDIYDAKSGELIRSTAWYEGSAYYNQYTVLFVFTFEGSDLVGHP